MPFNLGPLEAMFVLAITLLMWALPIAVLVWFIRSMKGLRDAVRRIEQRLERLD